jgi:hypothetical protein
MMAFLLKRWGVAWLLALVLPAVPARAHDPFDGGVQMIVFRDRIEAKVTLGFDAAREFLRAAGLPPSDVSRATRPGQSAAPVRLPVALAAGLLGVHAGGQSVAPTAVLAAPGLNETNFLVIYPRPATDMVQLRAAYFDGIEYMRPGALVAVNAQRRLLSSAPLSKAAPSTTVPLTLEAAGVVTGQSAFLAYLKLGVEHILTGFDHLLFLCALLLGVQAARSMLVIVTAFTLTHSVTLALAALDVVALSPSVIEPLIAASIVIACVDNLVRREATADRYVLAAGFGLIHGFGFAGALRATGLGQPGQGIVVPLLSFNLGVELGQMLVAALLVTLLLLARRKPAFVRYGLPGLSIAVIGISACWLVARVAHL